MLPVTRHAAFALVAAAILSGCKSNDAVAPPPPSWSKLSPLSGAAFGIARTNEGHLLTTLIDDGFLERLEVANASAQHDGVDVGGTPSVIATSADANTFYIANMAGWVEARSTLTGAQLAQVAISDAHALSVAPDGRVWVSGSAGNVYALDPASLSKLATIAVPGGPWGMAFHNVGTSPRLYVTARDAGTITEIDRTTNTVLRVIAVGGRPHGLVITPTGDRLFAADNATNAIKIVQVATGNVTKQIPFDGAFGLAISPDGKTIYASGDKGDVAVINVSSGTIVQSWPTGGQARQIVTSEDGTRAYFANMGGWVDLVTR